MKLKYFPRLKVHIYWKNNIESYLKTLEPSSKALAQIEYPNLTNNSFEMKIFETFSVNVVKTIMTDISGKYHVNLMQQHQDHQKV